MKYFSYVLQGNTSNTKITAIPRPKAVFTFFDTAKYEHIPKKNAKIILSMKIDFIPRLNNSMILSLS